MVMEHQTWANVRDMSDYTSIPFEDGAALAQAQKLWKSRRTGGRAVAAVLEADVSGSIDESARLINLKKALTEAANLISSNNSIGLFQNRIRAW